MEQFRSSARFPELSGRAEMIRSVRTSIACGVALSALLLGDAGVPTLHNAALAQPAHRIALTAEFRDALAPFGDWVEDRRWGEVWVPTNVPADWQPYKLGHWAYTQEWGWY